MDAYLTSLATFVAINVTLALGLNLITGFCGQVSLGHAAFFGTGAYAAALVTTGGFPFAHGVAAAILAAGLLGLIVGLASLRVREDFLAITTMGAGFLFLGFVRKQEWLGGEFGIPGIRPPFAPEGMAVLAILSAVLVWLASIAVRRSWMGRIFMAIARDEEAASSIGIDTARFKLAAFLLGTMSAGLAGAVYAHVVQLIVPDAFGFIQSITILAMVVVGGIGSNLGAVLGAVLLTLLPEMFRFVDTYKLLVYGGLLILVMHLSPDGLVGIGRRLLRAVRR